MNGAHRYVNPFVDYTLKLHPSVVTATGELVHPSSGRGGNRHPRTEQLFLARSMFMSFSCISQLDPNSNPDLTPWKLCELSLTFDNMRSQTEVKEARRKSIFLSPTLSPPESP